MRPRSVFSRLENGGDQLILPALDFRLLYLDLLFFLHLLDLHLFGNHLLLHDVGLDVVGFVGLSLLPLGRLDISCFLISRSRFASACLACDKASARTRS